MKIKSIKKRYNSFFLNIDELDFSNNVSVIIGHVGSGKTTLLRTISSLINGSFKGKIDGFLKHDAELLPRMKIKEYIDYVDYFTYKYDKEKVYHLLEDFGFSLDERLRAHSKGQLDILTILVSFGSKTEYILLDEPFSRLDPLNRNKIIDLIIPLLDKQKFIITSHELRTLDRLFDYVVLLKDGNKVGEGKYQKIMENHANIEEWYRDNYQNK